MSSSVVHKAGLRKKIIFSILLVAIIPGAIGLLVTYYQGKKGIRESIGSSFQVIARETAKRLIWCWKMRLMRPPTFLLLMR